MPQVAIIGAGVSGLTLAHHLQAQWQVTVFDKSRGLGGRLATRRDHNRQYDMGAQYFTARDESFQHFLQPFLEQGIIQAWEPRVLTLDPEGKPFVRPWFEPHYVGVPQMNSLLKVLSEGLDLRLGQQIQRCEKRGRQWWLMADDASEHGPFDWLVCTAPVPQSRALLGSVESAQAFMAEVEMQPCLAFMAVIPATPRRQWQAAQPRNSFLRWLACDSSKPGRDSDDAWVIHASNDWSARYWDEADEVLCAEVRAELCRLGVIDEAESAVLQIKRWRYARTATPAGSEHFLDSAEALGMCADWCLGDHVEQAFLSAHSLATSLNCLYAGERGRDGRRFMVSNQRGEARSKVRYVEGTAPGPGCRFLK